MACAGLFSPSLLSSRPRVLARDESAQAGAVELLEGARARAPFAHTTALTMAQVQKREAFFLNASVLLWLLPLSFF